MAETLEEKTAENSNVFHAADERMPCERTRRDSTFLDLPSELHGMVLQHLPYPDSVSLKITHPYFQKLIQPTHDVAARVTWLLSRADDGLYLPHTRKLNLRTDQAFLANPEVRTILKNRRSHEECGQTWLKADRKHKSWRNWFFWKARPSSQALPPCLVNPNLRTCTGIQKIMANKSGIMNIEKRYSTVKGGVTSRLSLLLTSLRLISFGRLICAAALASGFVFFEYSTQSLAPWSVSEIILACQSIMLGAIVSLVFVELSFRQPIVQR